MQHTRHKTFIKPRLSTTLQQQPHNIKPGFVTLQTNPTQYIHLWCATSQNMYRNVVFFIIGNAAGESAHRPPLFLLHYIDLILSFWAYNPKSLTTGEASLPHYNSIGLNTRNGSTVFCFMVTKYLTWCIVTIASIRGYKLMHVYILPFCQNIFTFIMHILLRIFWKIPKLVSRKPLSVEFCCWGS